MTERVSSEERAIITQLIQAGLDRVEARVAVLLATRSYARPLPDLVATLQHYAELEDPQVIKQAIAGLIRAGLVTRITTPLGNDIVGPAVDIAGQLATFAGNSAMETDLKQLRRSSDANIVVIGPLRDAASYESYAERLRDAQSDIRMPIVMTDPAGLETVAILKARAAAGVKVRVLGAAPKVIERLRGASQVGVARARIDGWRQVARASNNIEYRLSDYEEDMLFATSILIDGEVLRLVLHDPLNERSKEGLVVEVGGGSSKGVNLIRDFAARFDIAWRHARRPGAAGNLTRWAQSSWQVVLASLLFTLAYATADVDSGLGKKLGSQWQPFVFNVALPVASALLAASWQRMRNRAAERHALASGG